MSKVCQVTGKRPQTGNNVSHAHNKTRRRFLPNLQNKRFWLESEQRWVRLRVSHKGMRIIDKHGIDKVLADIRSRGARLVAVSPELPDASLSHAQKLQLEFDVLSDVGNGVAGEYGLIMTVPPELRPLYREWGIDLSAANGDTTHQLPVPATYVIDRSGTIRAAYVDKDYTRRMEPDAIIEALIRALYRETASSI